MLTLSASALGLLMIAILSRPRSLFYLTVGLAFLSVPAAIPTTWGVAGLSIQAYEPFLILSTLYALIYFPVARETLIRECALLALFLVGAAYGLANGFPLAENAILSDILMPLYMVFALMITTRIIGTDLPGKIWRFLIPVLWFSAAVTLADSALGFSISGLSEDSVRVSGQILADVGTRIRSPASWLSVAVVCGILAYVASTNRKVGSLAPWLIPAAFIATVSFSRNTVLALVVTLLFVLFANRDFRLSVIKRTVGYFVVASVGVVIVLILVHSWSENPLSAWVVEQQNGFTQRIVNGLSRSELAIDASAQYRLTQENPYLISAIRESPIVGHGFGFPYRPLYSGGYELEEAQRLQYYAHNFYLWLWTKAGVLGLLVFVWAAVVPVLTSFRGSKIAIAAGAASAGLLASSLVAPVPLGTPSALLLGILFGLCWDGRIRREPLS